MLSAWTHESIAVRNDFGRSLRRRLTVQLMAPGSRPSPREGKEYWIGDRRRVNPGKYGPALTEERVDESRQIKRLLDQICADRSREIAQTAQMVAHTLTDEDPAPALQAMARLAKCSDQLGDLLWLRAVFTNETYPQIARRLGLSKSGVLGRVNQAVQRVELDEDKPLEAALKDALDAEPPKGGGAIRGRSSSRGQRMSGERGL